MSPFSRPASTACNASCSDVSSAGLIVVSSIQDSCTSGPGIASQSRPWTRGPSISRTGDPTPDRGRITPVGFPQNKPAKNVSGTTRAARLLMPFLPCS